MVLRLRVLLLIATMAGIFTACKNNFDDPATGQADRNLQEINKYLIENGLASRTSTTSSGLTYQITTPSSQTRVVQTGEEVEITYRISYLDNGKVRVADTSAANTPVRLPYGANIMVVGLEEGLRLMRIGQQNLFYMPNNLAFGGKEVSKIPAYSAVIFDVTLQNIRSENEQIREYQLANKLTAPLFVAADSSLYVYRTLTGSGVTINDKDSITVERTGRTLRGTTPVEQIAATKIRVGSILPTGLNTALQKLRVGDRATVVMRSGQAYGSQGLPNRDRGVYVVPPYAPLVYDIRITAR